MKKALLMVSFFSSFLAIMAQAAEIRVNPEKAEIVVQRETIVSNFAAAELQLHFQLITGVKIPIVRRSDGGKYPFYVGTQAPGGKSIENVEQACIDATADGVWFWGQDRLTKGGIFSSGSATGTLFAVYIFLEEYLDVRWVSPGNQGISFKPSEKLVFKTSKSDWTPELPKRHIRSMGGHKYINQHGFPNEFKVDTAEWDARAEDTRIWLKRMRMGDTWPVTYGHSFTNWWEMYGEQHPEWFAMGANGKRPSKVNRKRARRLKMCVSNKELIKEIPKVNKTADNYIRGTENDSRGFCHCKDCLALDANTPRELKLPLNDRPVSDRYVWFWNEILKEARKTNPEARVVAYAYSRYREAPRKIKLAKGITLGLLPNLMDDIDKYVNDWSKAGLRESFMRTNDMNQEIGMPSGFEQRMFGNFNTAYKTFDRLFGTDYDILHDYWPTNALCNYVMAKAFSDPGKDFAYWESHFTDGFGDAKPEVSEFFKYYRDAWQNRVEANNEAGMKKISDRPPTKMFRAKMMHSMDFLFNEKDFDTTDAILAKALAKTTLTPEERARIEELALGNKHSRLTWKAMLLNAADNSKLTPEGRRAAEELLKFRIANKDKLNINWNNLFYHEYIYSHETGQNCTTGIGAITSIPRR